MTPAAFNLQEACAYVGGVSRQTFWRATRAKGIEPNIFGTYSRQDLDALVCVRGQGKKRGSRRAPHPPASNTPVRHSAEPTQPQVTTTGAPGQSEQTQ